MSRSSHLATHLSVAELERRYRAAHEPHERSWWQTLWLLARGQIATAIADTTGYNRGWIGQIAKRYNDQGQDAMVNRQHTTSWWAPRMLSAQQQEELRQALTGPAPDGAKRWRARDVADWMCSSRRCRRRQHTRCSTHKAPRCSVAGLAGVGSIY